MPALHAISAHRKSHPSAAAYNPVINDGQRLCGVQQNCYQDYRAALDRAQASADEADQLLHHCRETMEDAVVALSTPSESAASDDDAQEDEISPIGDYWAQVAHASGGSGQLQAQGKFWSQKVQLQALTRNVQAFTENRSQLLCVVAETAHLQVCSCRQRLLLITVSLCAFHVLLVSGYALAWAYASRRPCRRKSCVWPKRQRR